MPLPIGAPSGITAAQPTSSRRRARIGSSFVYGSTTNPSSTSVSAASSSSVASGKQRAVVADHLELDPVGLERLARHARGQHGVVRRVAARPCSAAGSSRLRSSISTSDPGAATSTRRSATVTISAPDAAIASLHHVEAAEAAGAEDQARAPACGRRSRRRVGACTAHPPWIAPSTSTRWPSDSSTPSHALRGTTSASTATATPRPSAAAGAAARAPAPRP